MINQANFPNAKKIKFSQVCHVDWQKRDKSLHYGTYFEGKGRYLRIRAIKLFSTLWSDSDNDPNAPEEVAISVIRNLFIVVNQQRFREQSEDKAEELS